MKRTASCLNDMRVTRGGGNVFIDLGFDPAEAEIMALRAEVMISNEQRLKPEGRTQMEAPGRLRNAQRPVSKPVKGTLA